MRRAAGALLQALTVAGARDVESYWINGTVGASVAFAALHELAARADVTRVMLMVRRTVTC